MLMFRRLPGLCYNHVYAFALSLVLGLVIIFFLLSRGFLCSNLEPWRHVNRLCARYAEGGAVGDMCEALCVERTITSYSCRAFHSGKDAVFVASWINSSHRSLIVFKSTADLILQTSEHLDIFNKKRKSGQPNMSEEEFVSIIQLAINSRLNISLSKQDAESLGRFPSGSRSPPGTHMRLKEMVEISNLLRDNEFLLSRVYESVEIFPRVLGTCGQFYFTEYLEPILDSQLSKLFGSDGSWRDWQSRLQTGSQLIELVDFVDSVGLLMCDVKPSHFGLSISTNKMKLLDLDDTLPKETADSLSSDRRPCQTDQDCSILDCESKCHHMSNTCRSPITSTNLQVMCQKVFMGSSGHDGSDLVTMGGLLLGDRTPGPLASMLRRCAKGTIYSAQLGAALTKIHSKLTDSTQSDIYDGY